MSDLSAGAQSAKAEANAGAAIPDFAALLRTTLLTSAPCIGAIAKRIATLRANRFFWAMDDQAPHAPELDTREPASDSGENNLALAPAVVPDAGVVRGVASVDYH